VDVLLTIAFYACAGLALAGALGAALLPSLSPWRAPGLFALAVGTAGMLASLSAGFAAVVALVCLLAAGLLLTGRQAGAAPALGVAREARWIGQLAAAAGVGLFAVLAYAALRGDYVHGAYPGGGFGAAALGRLFFSRDALALEAVAFLLLIALGAAAAVRQRRP
jgi:NADH:ubiquinone oxidoreductase subunit 6 (subunit J)